MFKKIFLTSFVFATYVMASNVPAWGISLSDVINTLETPFQKNTDKEYLIQDYSADFFQESKIVSLDRLQRANGRVEVAFVKFRWEYDQPTNQEIVSDGETMWVYLPENNQVIQSNIELVNKANQNNPMTFLTGLGNLSRDFSITWASPNRDVGGNYVLELTPRRISSLINKLIIVVDLNAVDAYISQTQGNTSAGSDLPEPPDSSNPLLKAQSALSADSGFGNFGDPRGGIWFPILSTTVYDPNGNSTLIEFSNLLVNYGISDLTFDFTIPAGVQVVRPTGKEMGF